MKTIKAAFLDRDGTIIEDVKYLSRLENIKLIPHAVKICHLLQQKNYKLFVFTNQSGIARGMFDEEFVKKTHSHISQIFEKNGVIFEKFYYCPHHPTEAIVPKYDQMCECRKPKPGMLLKAAQEYPIDLAKSIAIGNEQKDLVAGQRAGCKSFDINQLFNLSPEKCAKLL